MSDDRLREAARVLREQWYDTRRPDRRRQRRIDVALSDWLDAVADDYAIAKYGYWSVRATAVADAILEGGDR